MTPTTDKPTKPGWYWHTPASNRHKWRVIKIDISPFDDTTLYAQFSGRCTAIEQAEGVWAGPIPEPEEA